MMASKDPEEDFQILRKLPETPNQENHFDMTLEHQEGVKMHNKGRNFKPKLAINPEPIDVAITGAAGAIGSNVCHFIG
jgi:hypothetical protein